jgi:hypothetical protein
VKGYALGIHKEVGVIAHSCGVTETRGLRRSDCRVVQDNGTSVALNDLYPDQLAFSDATQL